GLRDSLQSGGDLAWDDHEGASRTCGDLWQRLEVLVGEELGIRVVAVDGLEHLIDRLSLAVGPQHGGLLVALGGEDGALLLTLGGQDLRLADALRGQDRGSLLTVRAHLALHRLLDRRRWVDGL